MRAGQAGRGLVLGSRRCPRHELDGEELGGRAAPQLRTTAAADATANEGSGRATPGCPTSAATTFHSDELGGGASASGPDDVGHELDDGDVGGPAAPQVPTMSAISSMVAMSVVRMI